MSTKLAVALRVKYHPRCCAPHDGHRAVGDEELVMHAVVEPGEIGNRRHVFVDDACRPQQNGLKSRTSTLVNAARPRNIGSPPTV